MSECHCRFCGAHLTLTFADLGMSPLSNAYLDEGGLHRMEPYYPLHARVCDNCWLVQVEAFESPEALFGDYAYFSSYSDNGLRHARAYVQAMIPRFDLGAKSSVMEIASNDGYLLQYFRQAGIPVLGIEPARNIAAVAEQKGIQTLCRFFGSATARQLVADGQQADLLLGNNVLAHVPDLNDFVAGLKILLQPRGVITLEFPHLLRLIADNQFDTIYHEHFSYFSLLTVEQVLDRHGLSLFDVEELPTHGGSLRIFARHAEMLSPKATSHVERIKAIERIAGLDQPRVYGAFARHVRESKRALLECLIGIKRAGKTIVGYGAAAKGNTLFNYCGIGRDFIEYVADLSPHKQGRFLPGSHLPVVAPEKISETRPDYVLILPWNLQHEIIEQMSHIRQWGGRFMVPIPTIQVLP